MTIIYMVVVIRADGKEIYRNEHRSEEDALKDVERINNIIDRHRMRSKYEVIVYPEIAIEK